VQSSDLMVLGDPSQEILIRDLPSFIQLGAIPVLDFESALQDQTPTDD